MHITRTAIRSHKEKIMKNIRLILWFCIAAVIRRSRMTCGTCWKQGNINCGIVCDRCAVTNDIYEKGHPDKYFCGSYEPRM